MMKIGISFKVYMENLGLIKWYVLTRLLSFDKLFNCDTAFVYDSISTHMDIEHRRVVCVCRGEGGRVACIMVK